MGSDHHSHSSVRKFENTILQVTVNNSYNPYLMCLINATEVEDSKLAENITLLLKQTHLKKNSFMQNNTSEKHSSIPELLKLKLISQILQLESCSIRPADPQLQTVAEEFCNLSLSERTRETYIMGVTLLRHLDIYNFLYKMFFPKELQKSVDKMLGLLTKMKYFRHQVESGVDPLLQAIHSLKKLRQSRNMPLTKSNATLKQMADLALKSQEWLDKSPVIMNSLTKLNQTVPMIKETCKAFVFLDVWALQEFVWAQKCIIFKLPSSHSSPGRSVDGDSVLPPVLNYTIRMSSRITQTTNRIRERIWTVGPHNSTSQSQIYSRAFIYIQDSIERAIIELQTGKNPEEIAVQVQAMPYPCYNKDMFLTSVTYSLPFALMAAWVLFIADFVKTLVQEKDLRLYECLSSDIVTKLKTIEMQGICPSNGENIALKF
ncbi:atp-binding cassette sub-family a member 12 [Limosa lapponica baueri]|uniref:Atp-binding cassette sub-family a member 12 n=1 Tax=Limosa lapponica baueri TaxID=1758121 RepID=A0A2I0TBB9_LIMLA|nr:atp-binding cassette sub-family a member 12 [Limosa lapponica baueri]